MTWCFTCGKDETGDENFETVCSDCCVAMCDQCKYDDDNLCGCYGTCDSCNCAVNRGSDGRKCMDCQEWLCYDCKMKSECSMCGSGINVHDSDSDSDSDSADADADADAANDNGKCI